MTTSATSLTSFTANRERANVTTTMRAGRITAFGFAVGAGLLIASGAGAAVAAAAPDGQGHTASSSSAAGGSTSAARSGRPSTKPKPAQKASVRTDNSRPVVQLQTANRTPAAASPTAPNTLTAAAPVTTDLAAPVASVKQSRAQRLPTPAEIQQAIVAGLDAARREIDTFRNNLEVLVKHQIEGIRDNLTQLRYDLLAIFGPSRTPVNPDIPSDDTPGIIGNPDAKKLFFIYQGQAQSCVLMATAMVIGQLTGTMPTAAQIINEGLTTPSTVKSGPMYNPQTGTNSQDVLALLEKHGIEATSTQYSKGQGELAWNDLKQTLISGDSVIAVIKSQILWGRGTPDMAFTGDHDITVLGINTNTDEVYINDSAWDLPEGQGMVVSKDLFLRAWAANEYWSISARLAPVTNGMTTLAT
jgi:hypothetical protein